MLIVITVFHNFHSTWLGLGKATENGLVELDEKQPNNIYICMSLYKYNYNLIAFRLTALIKGPDKNIRWSRNLTVVLSPLSANMRIPTGEFLSLFAGTGQLSSHSSLRKIVIKSFYDLYVADTSVVIPYRTR